MRPSSCFSDPLPSRARKQCTDLSGTNFCQNPVPQRIQIHLQSLQKKVVVQWVMRHSAPKNLQRVL